MKANQDLASIEEKIYQHFSKDGAIITAVGILFIWAGLCLSFLGSIPRMSEFANQYGFRFFVYPGMLIAYVLIRVWRQRITFPRLGYSKFIASRNIPKSMLLRFVILCLVLILVFGLLMRSALVKTSIEHLHGDLSIIGILLGIGMSIAGIILGIKRLCMMVIPLVGMILLAAYIPINIGWVVILAGLVMISIGIDYLRHFLREYPVTASADVQ